MGLRQERGEAIGWIAIADLPGLAVEMGDRIVGATGVILFVLLNQMLFDGVTDRWLRHDLQGEKRHAQVGGIPAEAAFAGTGRENRDERYG